MAVRAAAAPALGLNSGRETEQQQGGAPSPIITKAVSSAASGRPALPGGSTSLPIEGFARRAHSSAAKRASRYRCDHREAPRGVGIGRLAGRGHVAGARYRLAVATRELRRAAQRPPHVLVPRCNGCCETCLI